MKKLFLILLIALTICSANEESFDDNAVLEVSKGKAITSTKARHPTKDAIGITTRLTSKVKNVRNLPIKGTNYILKRKSREEFRKQDIVKDRYDWLKKNNLRHLPPQNNYTIKTRNPGQRYGRKRNGI